jgi:P-type Ca2+ transporter type 2C
LIEAGDIIAADGRLCEAIALQVAEAALTGESLPIQKQLAPISSPVGVGDRTNMVFRGTVATYGRGNAIVTATGMQTEMGKIAGLLQRTPHEETPLQKQLDQTGKLLGMIVLVIAVIVVTTTLVKEGITEFGAVIDVLIFGVALAVAAVPEGLPAIVTATLAIGVQRMASCNAIVRKLPAVETLGSVTVIASDKTGTLTRNEMTVRVVATASGQIIFGGSGYTPTGSIEIVPNNCDTANAQYEAERALRAAALTNNAQLQHSEGNWSIQGDPTEAALLVAAHKLGLTDQVIRQRFTRLHELPFSSERKRMSVVTYDSQRADRLRVFSKGAPDVLLELCSAELVGDQNGNPCQSDSCTECTVGRPIVTHLGGSLTHTPSPCQRRDIQFT